jgi:heme-degrading monooxygenase HmoA
MYVALFWGKPNPEWNKENFGKLGFRMYQLASQMPGFVALHRFDTPDGGELAIAYFDTEEHMKAWYNQPEHRALETLARREILDDYTIEIAHITRSYTKASSHFKATEAEERGADLLAANPEAAIV